MEEVVSIKRSTNRLNRIRKSVRKLRATRGLCTRLALAAVYDAIIVLGECRRGPAVTLLKCVCVCVVFFLTVLHRNDTLSLSKHNSVQTPRAWSPRTHDPFLITKHAQVLK